ncbi:MAG: acetylxylan esterase [Thermomicrobiales bacterium]
MRPANFDSYWDNVDAELEAFPARPVLEELPMRSNEHCTVYALRLTSIGPYRIFGYLSVPRGAGPFPALLQTPRYGSVNHIPDYNDRLRYVCLQIMHRGQRLADQPYSASYPGLLTDGIVDQDGYIYRGIVADCMRAAEYLLGRDDVDQERVAIQGDDLALITAARRTGFALVNASGLMFYRLAEARLETSSYPAEEINEFCRAFPDNQDDAEETLALFDPQYHVGGLQSPVLLAIGGDRDWFQPLLDQLGDNCQIYELTHRGGTDHDNIDRLIAERLETPPMSRFIRTLSH